ncbi:AbrB/MazE/SpoVT family DNA-binding domain-containing protein [Sulfurimonas sp.]
MQVSLIDIGTSRGIRIPATVLKSFNDLKTFDLKVEDSKIILNVIKNPRDGWEDKFKNSKNDLLIDDKLDIEDWDEL